MNIHLENYVNCDSACGKRANIPILMPIDSLWKYYDVSMTTSGRCSRPDIFDDDSSKNLLYGFYTVLDVHSSRMPPIVAKIVVSYHKNSSWWSSDTTQRIREIVVMDSLFVLPIARFKVGDHICLIPLNPSYHRDNYYCYNDRDCRYLVEVRDDTIVQYYIFPSTITCDWGRILQYVKPLSH